MYIYQMSLKESSVQDMFAEKWPVEPQPLPVFPVTADLTNQLGVFQYTLHSAPEGHGVRQVG